MCKVQGATDGKGDPLLSCCFPAATIPGLDWCVIFGCVLAGHLKVVQLLRQAKADPSAKNKQQKAPADVAKNEDVAKAISQ